MPRKKYHERLQEGLQGKPGAAPPVEPPSDLELREVQNDIMDPKGAELVLSYTSIRMYPLTVAMKRRATGLLARVLADAAGAGSRSDYEMKMRMVSLLNSRDDLQRSLFEMVAVAVHEPGVIRSTEDPKVEPLVDELQESASSSDVVLLFSRISLLSGFNMNPKNEPTTLHK